MTISGEELGAELYDLRRAGRVSLPKVAAIYAQGSRHMHNTSWKEDEAFDSGSYVEYEENSDIDKGAFSATVIDAVVLGATAGPWRGLRDELQRYMGDTATSLDRAGLALEQIADAYAETDDAAAQELEEQSEGLQERPEIPDVKRPGSSHDTVTETHDNNISVGPWDIPLPDRTVESPQDEPTDPLQ